MITLSRRLGFDMFVVVVVVVVVVVCCLKLGGRCEEAVQTERELGSS